MFTVTQGENGMETSGYYAIEYSLLMDIILIEDGDWDGMIVIKSKPQLRLWPPI